MPLLYPDVRCEIPQIKKLVCWALIKESHAKVLNTCTSDKVYKTNMLSLAIPFNPLLYMFKF